MTPYPCNQYYIHIKIKILSITCRPDIHTIKQKYCQNTLNTTTK